MNEGIMALLVQWTLLICAWMGLFDSAIQKSGFSRAKLLATLTAFLCCSFANWELYFMPLAVNVSGVILPFLLAGWMYVRLTVSNKEYILAAGILCACVILFMRKLLFWDPILLVVEEILLVPLLCIILINLIARNFMHQLFVLLLALPLSDLLYVGSNVALIPQVESSVAGSLEAQDIFWVSIGVWVIAKAVWEASKVTGKITMKPLQTLRKSKTKNRI
ncbi:YphA family membrane protein [Brevibacillus sp. SYSU BS000544]|uniref:YphA family membrane protein n=1 Tax=Brevibacillus sp. SYSU BS000544 TaxID=3416443 RepID=UPI003CE5232A